MLRFLAANFVLEHTCERRYVGNRFGDIPLGLYLIRGENVVLLGELVRHQPHAFPPAPVPCVSCVSRCESIRRPGARLLVSVERRVDS